MRDDAASITPDRALGAPRARLRRGLAAPANWAQLVRFAAVGASGVVVNLAVYTALVHPLGVDPRLAAVAAWLVAVANNFLWNRSWTFRAASGSATFQAPRFLVVSAGALLANLAVLDVLVLAGVPAVPAQLAAIAAATPANFLGNKLWSFRR